MPDWTDPVARYILQEGLPNTLRVAAIAVVGSTLIGVILGTLLTIRFLPLRAAIRLYVEIFRGLPILVTVFATFFLLPTISPELEFSPLNAGAIALTLWGSAQVAETTRGAVQSISREQRVFLRDTSILAAISVVSANAILRVEIGRAHV